MNTENKKVLQDVLQMLDRDWHQVLNSYPDNIEEATAEQIKSNTIAMVIMDKIREQIAHYLITGEKKDIEILFNEQGRIYL